MGRFLLDGGVAMKTGPPAQSSPVAAYEPHRDIFEGRPSLQDLGRVALGWQQETIRKAPGSHKRFDNLGL